MITTQKEMFAVRFADCMARLKALGLNGEVSVVAGLVMIATNDKYSAQSFRKAIKGACKKSGAVSVETRPNKNSYVFTVSV